MNYTAAQTGDTDSWTAPIHMSNVPEGYQAGRVFLFGSWFEIALTADRPGSSDPVDVTVGPAGPLKTPPAPGPHHRRLPPSPFPNTLSAIDYGRDELTMTFGHAVVFSVRQSDVLFWADPTTSPQLVLALFYGPVLSAWLELRGIVTLHGGAFATRNGVAALVAPGGTGKSTLLGAMIRRQIGVFSDDQVPVAIDGDRLNVLPAYPAIRVTKPTARYLGVDESTLAPIPMAVKGKYLLPVPSMVRAAAPLRAVFFLERRATEAEAVHAVRLSGVEAFARLQAHGSAPNTVSTARLESTRFSTLSLIAQRIPCYAFRYPTGLDRIDSVVDALVAYAAEVP